MSLVNTIVLIQVFVVAAFAAATLLLMFVRRIRELRFKNTKLEMAEILVLAMMEENPQMDRPKGKLLRAALQNALIEQIEILSGAERNSLIRLYRSLGYLKDDVIQSVSTMWWHRLEAIMRLSALKDPALAPFFAKMKEDSHPLVMAHALLALSEVNHELNTPNLESLRPSYESGRQSLLIEVLMNWCKMRGFKEIFDMILAQDKSPFRETLLLCLLNTRSPDSVEELSLLLLLPEDARDPALVAATLVALREIGDPQVTTLVHPLIFDPDDRIRERALEFILNVSPESIGGDWPLFVLDSSVRVRRLMQGWGDKVQKEAA